MEDIKEQCGDVIEEINELEQELKDSDRIKNGKEAEHCLQLLDTVEFLVNKMEPPDKPIGEAV